jgi:hypothetical protein
MPALSRKRVIDQPVRRMSYPQHIHNLETLEFEAPTTTCCARIHRLHERAHRPLPNLLTAIDVRPDFRHSPG